MKKELFTDKRWHQDLGGKVVGHVDIPKDEPEDPEFLEFIKQCEEKRKELKENTKKDK